MRRAVTIRLRSLTVLAALGAFLAAAPARAQQDQQARAAPELPEDPRAPHFAEVERGMFAGFEVGALMLFSTPVADRARFPFAGNGGGRASGFLMGAHVGYDVTEQVAVSIFALGANAQAGTSYGAFDLGVIGGDLRYSFPGWRDRNGVERLHFYVHGRSGWVATRPSGLLGTTDLLVAGGPGVEYFTRLRHFSVGLAADGLFLTRAGVGGISIAPSVRYTF
jgi:hypothetical protein